MARVARAFFRGAARGKVARGNGAVAGQSGARGRVSATSGVIAAWSARGVRRGAYRVQTRRRGKGERREAAIGIGRATKVERAPRLTRWNVDLGEIGEIDIGRRASLAQRDKTRT